MKRLCIKTEKVIEIRNISIIMLIEKNIGMNKVKILRTEFDGYIMMRSFVMKNLSLEWDLCYDVDINKERARKIESK
ncbi:MAG: hypothetical protein LBL77_03235 [Endomicrobium sp.]|nr:hypothetical protein [Endomicrobium sp.]